MRVRNHTGKHQVVDGVHIPYGGWLSVEPDSTVATTGYRHGLLDWRFTPQDALRRDVIHWKSPFSLADGYATAAEQMCMALDGLGVQLYMEPCWFDDTTGLDPWTRRKLKEPFPGFAEVGVCMATPGEFRLLPTRYRIGYTMYEADNPLEKHPEWKHDCERADMLVVPSDYCRDVFSKFFPRDIAVAPLVVNGAYYQPKKRTAKDIFTFVSYGTLSGRKAPLETIECFQKAFPTEKDVRLVLKTRFGVCGYSYHQLPSIDDDRVTIISTGKNPRNPDGLPDWSEAEVRDWLYAADCMLFLSKGEGYGLPPREALATGLPLIYAANTGMLDIQGGWPIPTDHVEDSPIGGSWRIPDWDMAVDVMRDIYRRREKCYELAYQDALHAEERRLDGAKALLNILSYVGGYSTRPEVEPETLRDIPEHAEFYDIVGEHRGPYLDVGMGEGLAYIALSKRGHDVYGVCPPDRYETLVERIRAAGVEPRVVPGMLTDFRLPSGWPKPGLCVCQGVLQDYSVPEIRLVINAALRVAPVMFSVPSAHYPRPYSEHAQMGWRKQWEDLLNGYSKSVRFYAKKRHIMGKVTGMGFPVDKLHGYMTRDGVWRSYEESDD